VRSKRRALVAMGVVVLETMTVGSIVEPGYLGNWQPTRETKENPKRDGWSWLPAYVLDWG
jgi:hypothetical protein